MKKIILILIIAAMLYRSLVAAADYRTSTATQATFGTLYCSDHTAHSLYSAAGWTAAPTAEYTLVTCTIPGGTMGANGTLSGIYTETHSNSANTKTIKVKFGGSNVRTQAPTTTASISMLIFLRNRNSESSQIDMANVAFASGSSGNPNQTYSVNTAQTTTLVFTGQTTTEAGVQTTSLSGDGSTCTAVKASHGYNAGEYLQVSSGSNCATSGSPNANPVQIISAVTNTFTYACSCSGAESGTQPTAYRYSVIQLEAYDVEIKKP